MVGPARKLARVIFEDGLEQPPSRQSAQVRTGEPSVARALNWILRANDVEPFSHNFGHAIAAAPYVKKVVRPLAHYADGKCLL